MSTTYMYAAKSAKELLIEGANLLAEAVGTTMGPGGKNVVLWNKVGKPIVTKDGLTVAKYFQLPHPVQNMGADLVKQAAESTVEIAGDGTTTATVLSQAMLNNAKDLDITNMSEFRKGMESIRNEIIDLLHGSKKLCRSYEDLYAIGLTASNNDAVIADKLANIILQIGENGSISLETSDFSETTVSVDYGYKYNKGYLSSNFINNVKTGTVEYKHSHILIVRERLENFKDIKPYLIVARDNNATLIVVAKDYSEEFISNCVENSKRSNIIIPLLAPDFGNDMLANLEDLALYCDTGVFSIANIKNPEANMRIGLVDSVKITKDSTLLFSSVQTPALAERIQQLAVLKKQATNSRDKTKIEERETRLSAGIAVIKIGGETTTERQERFDRYDDAKGAMLSAYQNGVLPGGGLALYNIKQGLPTYVEYENIHEDFVVGSEVVLSALDAPYLKILTNAGITETKTKDTFSYNAATGEYVDFLKVGITDPIEVTIAALTNAVQ